MTKNGMRMVGVILLMMMIVSEWYAMNQNELKSKKETKQEVDQM